jgi:hypothetical protein
MYFIYGIFLEVHGHDVKQSHIRILVKEQGILACSVACIGFMITEEQYAKSKYV